MNKRDRDALGQQHTLRHTHALTDGGPPPPAGTGGRPGDLVSGGSRQQRQARCQVAMPSETASGLKGAGGQMGCQEEGYKGNAFKAGATS